LLQSTALTRQPCLVNQDVVLRLFSQQIHYPRLTPRTNKEQCSSYVLEEKAMIRTFVEEAAALASIVLFVGMIAVWAQLIPQL
jgi:hypothetical protein